MLRLGPQIIATPSAEHRLPLMPTPTRPPLIGGRLDTGKLWSGITVHAQVDPTPGGPASVERLDPQSYVIDLNLKVRVPTPNRKDRGTGASHAATFRSCFPDFPPRWDRIRFRRFFASSTK